MGELNARFTVVAKGRCDLHRRVPRGVDLDQILVFQEERVVQNDCTLRWRNRWFQVTGAPGRLSLAGKRLLVREQLDGTIRLVYRGRELDWRELLERPERKRTKATAGQEEPRGASAIPWKPAAEHPWRRFRLH